MKHYINQIKKLLENHEPLTCYIQNYPIKIVHEQTRIKESDILEKLQSIHFFNDHGFSNSHYPRHITNYLLENAPEYIQCSSYAISSKDHYVKYNFSEKFPHDKWKKISNDKELKAIIEVSKFSESDILENIETTLRDIMRSRKEVPLLKKTAFIWIAELPKNLDISKIMHHYFLENFISFERQNDTIFLGWNEQLQNINMRYFVFQPNS